MQSLITARVVLTLGQMGLRFITLSTILSMTAGMKTFQSPQARSGMNSSHISRATVLGLTQVVATSLARSVVTPLLTVSRRKQAIVLQLSMSVIIV